MASLTTLVLADVQCAWCKKITGKKFLNSADPVSQRLIKKGERLITHGICPSCQAELLGEYNMKLRACL